MTTFVWNLMLALAWAFATGLFTVSNLLVGLVIGYLILWFAQPALGRSAYVAKVPQVGRFALFYLWQLMLANLRIAYDVLTLTHHMRPGVIAVPLEAETDAEITLLANLISLTPGTLSLDVSPDRRVLYVHVMYIDDDVEHSRRAIKDGLERRVLQVLR